MSQDPLTPQLAKANGDVKRLCEFFAARKDWDLAAGAETAAHDLEATARKLDDHLQALIRASGADPAVAAQPKIESAGDGTQDAPRLVRFATFLRDLDSWLVVQPGPTRDPEAIAALVEMETNLSCIVTAIAALSAAATRESEVEPIEEPRDEAPQGDNPPLEPTDNDAAGRPLQLVLDDTEERPLVQEIQERAELTSECKEIIDGFLAAWGLDYSYYNRKKLLERTLRWISSAPEGHALVLKMKTAEVPYEPYPSYISRDVLAGKEPEQDPWA